MEFEILYKLFCPDGCPGNNCVSLISGTDTVVAFSCFSFYCVTVSVRLADWLSPSLPAGAAEITVIVDTPGGVVVMDEVFDTQPVKATASDPVIRTSRPIPSRRFLQSF